MPYITGYSKIHTSFFYSLVSRTAQVSMPSVFEKLNLKAQDEILVINAPPSFEPELAALAGVTVLRDPEEARAVQFALAFATDLASVS